MTIVNSVLDSNYNIYGFIFEDGNFKDLQELKEMKFKNNQIKFYKDYYKELNNFKIKELPMKMKINNNFIEITNELELKKKILNKGLLCGFLCSINNIEKVFDMEDFYKVATWCHNINFMIRKNNNISFVVGKNGTKIKTLPILNIEKDIENIDINKLKTSIRKDTLKLSKNNSRIDIINLFNFLNKIDALLLKFPEEKYINTKETKKIDNKFIDLNIGEIISPNINFSDNKININMICKKMGNVNINNILYPVFHVTSKHLFLNGINYIKNIGLIIRNEELKVFENFLDSYDSRLLIKNYENQQNIQKIKSFLGNDNISIFTLNTEFLNIINNKIILDNNQLYEIFKDLIEYKTINRYLNLVKKEIKYQKNKKKFGIYDLLKDEVLDNLIEEGIDIFSGIYNKTGEIIAPAKSTVSAEIIYSIKGYKTIPSAIDIKNKKNSKFVTPKIEKIIDDIENETDLNNKKNKYEKYQEYYNKRQYLLTKKIWLFNLSNLLNESYCLNNGWIKIKETKNDKVDYIAEFNCVEKGLEDFYLKIINIKERY